MAASIPRVVAICGLKRSGKDTIADWLSSSYGYTKVKIADPLKHVCKYLFDLSEDQVELDAKEVVDARWGVTPRCIMQFFGTEMMQLKLCELMPSVGRSFWVQRFLRGCEGLDRIVVADVRFMHEYAAITEHFGKENVYVIKVVRPCVSACCIDTHESEKEWDSIPFHSKVMNSGTVHDLDLQLKCLFSTKSDQKLAASALK